MNQISQQDLDTIAAELSRLDRHPFSCIPGITAVWFLYEDESQLAEFRLGIVANRLIISRVMFLHRRQGIMTRMYNLVENILLRNYPQIDTITVQSVLTLEMAAWCKKNGFSRVNGCGDYAGDYQKNIRLGK